MAKNSKTENNMSDNEQSSNLVGYVRTVSYTHLTLPTIVGV